MKKILFVCPYPLKVAAGQRLKFEPHFKAMEKSGYDITVNSFMSNELWGIVSKRGNTLKKVFWTLRGLVKRILLIFSIKQYDCVYIFMNVFPFGPPILERIYVMLAKRVVFDIEDDLLTKEVGSLNWFVSILKSKKKSEYLIANADHIICSSPDLEVKCIALSKKNNVTFIPPTLEISRFHPKEIDKDSSSITKIGWTGTFSSREFLELIIPQLEKLYQKKRFKLVVIGNFEMQNPNLDLEVIQWNSETEIQQLHNFDIGLYPLPSGDWVSGKSGLKALQYMAIGIPAVCTAIGNVKNFIEHDKDGILIYNDADWEKSLHNLMENPKEIKSIGRNARATFLKHFSQESIFKKYLSVIKG